MAKTKVFVSHIRENATVAIALRDFLQDKFLGRVEVFVSTGGAIRAGDDWLKSLLTEISASDMMIVVCTNASVRHPWVNFEVGGAAVRGAKIIPICWDGCRRELLTPPFSAWQPVDLQNKDELGNLMEELAHLEGMRTPKFDLSDLVLPARRTEQDQGAPKESQASVDDISDVESFFEQIGVPAQILEGNGSCEYRDTGRGASASLQVDYEPEPCYTLDCIASPDLRAICDDILAAKLQEAVRAGRTRYNGDLLRLKEYQVQRNDRPPLHALELRLQPTNYYSFLATNHALESPGREEAIAHGLIAAEQNSVVDLSGSLLANPMTIALSIIAEEPDGTLRLILQKRNIHKVMHCWQKWQCGAAGMVNVQPDDLNSPNVFFAAAVREIAQEMDLAVNSSDIAFLALVREKRFYEVALVGEVCIKRGTHDFLRLPADSFETEKFLAVPFTPESFVSFLARVGLEELCATTACPNTRAQMDAGIQAFVPNALTACIMSLVHRFGAESVREAFLAHGPRVA